MDIAQTLGSTTIIIPDRMIRVTSLGSQIPLPKEKTPNFSSQSTKGRNTRCNLQRRNNNFLILLLFYTSLNKSYLGSHIPLLIDKKILKHLGATIPIVPTPKLGFPKYLSLPQRKHSKFSLQSTTPKCTKRKAKQTSGRSPNRQPLQLLQ